MPPREDERPDEGQTEYPVVVQPEAFWGVSPEARLERYREAIEAIVARAPVEHRAEVRDLLENPGRYGNDVSFVSSTDPEVARLLGVLASIYQANRRDES